MKIAFDVDVLAKQMDINRQTGVINTSNSLRIQGSIHSINTRCSPGNVRQNTGKHSGKPEWRSPPLS